MPHAAGTRHSRLVYGTTHKSEPGGSNAGTQAEALARQELEDSNAGANECVVSREHAQKTATEAVIGAYQHRNWQHK